MRPHRWTLLIIGLPSLAILVWLGVFTTQTRRPNTNRPDVSWPGLYDINAKSSDLTADLTLMWETKPLQSRNDPTHGPNPRSSTDQAINAASRVFNTVELISKTREEVIHQLGDPKTSNDSVYNFPFWPASTESLVYRFDSGAYGWQFNIIFDEAGHVIQVDRRWIH